MQRNRCDIGGVLNEARQVEFAGLQVHDFRRLVVDRNRHVDAFGAELLDVWHKALETQNLTRVRCAEFQVGVVGHPAVLVEA